MTFTAPKPKMQYDGISFAVITVTPKMAAEWLETNERNRPLTRKAFHRLAAQMQDGTFRFVGDPIRFSTEGKLLDGQHRLYGIIQADVSMPFLIIWGLDPDTQTVIDNNQRRTAAQALALTGIGPASLASSAARMLHRLEQKVPGVELTSDKGIPGVLDIIERHSGVLDYLERVSKVHPGLSRANVATYAYVIGDVLGKTDDAERYIDIAATGGISALNRDGSTTIKLLENDPVAMVRKDRIDHQQHVRKTMLKLHVATDAFIKGETPTWRTIVSRAKNLNELSLDGVSL